MEGNSRGVANREVKCIISVLLSFRTKKLDGIHVSTSLIQFLIFSIAFCWVLTLRLISIFHAGEPVPCYNALQGSGIQDKTYYGTTHRSLGHTKVNRYRLWSYVVNKDTLTLVMKIWWGPVERGASDYSKPRGSLRIATTRCFRKQRVA